MNKRVHEIAKERGLQPKEVLARLRAAGIDVKASSSSVDVDIASRILGNGNQNRPAAPPKAEPPTAAEAAKAAAGTVRAPVADPRRGSAHPRRGTPQANGQARAGSRGQAPITGGARRRPTARPAPGAGGSSSRGRAAAGRRRATAPHPPR